MSTLFTGTEYIIEFVITLLLLPFLIYLSFFIVYTLGKGLNYLLLKGRSFSPPHLLFVVIGFLGFFSLAITVFSASFIQIFSISTAEWWYKKVFPIGSTGNTIGILASLAAGFLRGRNDN
jgi:hypothetical protein